jgi:hypothetical protein
MARAHFAERFYSPAMTLLITDRKDYPSNTVSRTSR